MSSGFCLRRPLGDHTMWYKWYASRNLIFLPFSNLHCKLLMFAGWYYCAGKNVHFNLWYLFVQIEEGTVLWVSDFEVAVWWDYLFETVVISFIWHFPCLLSSATDYWETIRDTKLSKSIRTGKDDMLSVKTEVVFWGFFCIHSTLSAQRNFTAYKPALVWNWKQIL